MSDYRTKPRAGQHDIQHLSSLIKAYRLEYATDLDWAASSSIRLTNNSFAMVSLMRIPYSPYYDTSFIVKYFKPDNSMRERAEEVAAEAASMQHAAEAFQRNGNICQAPKVYHVWPKHNLIAMERIRARDLWVSAQGWWPKERMIKFVRHMAVIRLAILTQYRFRNWIDRGPFPNRHEMILASLRRELLVVRRMKQIGEPVDNDSYYDIDDTIAYLEMTIEKIDGEPRPTRPEFFSLNHYNLPRRSNIMVRGSKVAALRNWGSASYDPLFLCVSDLATTTDFNPRLWEEHGENFHVLPYRFYLDPMDGLFQNATIQRAERKPFPDWQLIDNHGGPLNEEDFCGGSYPEDISSDEDESIGDSVEMHCDSDADAEEELEPRRAPPNPNPFSDWPPIPGPRFQDLERRWYHQPVFSLMKEFIHHQRGAGLGPDGEWGKLPEEYSRPLADWEDPLFMNMTQFSFVGTRDQLIEDFMFEREVDQAAKVPAPTHNILNPNVQPRARKSPKRQRQVPALISTVQSSAMVGADIAPESPVSSSSSACLARNRLRRGKLRLPLTGTQKTGRNQDPILLSMLPRVQEPCQERQWAEMDHPAVEAELQDDDDVLVNGVRGSIIAKVMEQLWVRQDSGAEVP
ncbi:hypothetical protein HOY82DRAFT_590281 [Tuber indicum]|nr:hypothetical protein HOY82DRAFT_590281 [Tuber indicum]